MKDFFTLDSFDLSNQTVAVRIDLNSDLNERGQLEVNERFYAHAETVRELVEKHARIILIAHQSRKGEPDFISLKQHAEIFSSVLGKVVKFVDDVVGIKALQAINSLRPGEVLMLDNVRFLEDEDVEKSMEEHSHSSLVKFLLPLINYYVLDAFSVSHRSHASIVGFALVKPMVAGRVIEREVDAISKVTAPTGINTWLMGGAKVDDCIFVLKHMLENKPESLERVLTSGMLANLFLLAKGYEIGSGSLLALEKKGYTLLLKDAKELLEKYEKEIVLPVDVAFDDNGRREENVENIPANANILDIGSKTVAVYKQLIDQSRSIVIKGPMGKFEAPAFALGTKELLEKVADADATVLIGGGDTSVAIEKLGIDKKKFAYVSVGGGALISFLSGKKMPGLEALKESYKRFSPTS